MARAARGSRRALGAAALLILAFSCLGAVAHRAQAVLAGGGARLAAAPAAAHRRLLFEASHPGSTPGTGAAAAAAPAPQGGRGLLQVAFGGGFAGGFGGSSVQTFVSTGYTGGPRWAYVRPVYRRPVVVPSLNWGLPYNEYVPSTGLMTPQEIAMGGR